MDSQAVSITGTGKLKVLVTGGAGYIGSVLAEHLLDSGCEVTILDNFLYAQKTLFHLCAHPNFHIAVGDVRDEGLMRPLVSRADVIIPLAAIVGAPACDRNPYLAEGVNLGAIKLLNRLRSPNQLVVFPMTDSSYGAKSGGEPCTEDTPLTPVSLYGRLKAEAEKEILSKPNAISLRLATVFGVSPRMRIDLLVNHFVYAAITDGFLVIFEKDVKRNFVHVRDVADGFLHAVRNAERMAGRAYNLGHDQCNVSKEEVARKVQTHVPHFYIHFSEIGSDPDKRNYFISHERLKQTGFQARRTIDDGIRELVKAYTMMRHVGPYRNIEGRY